jgi:ParB-like chromosome segregation protein Spo0J
MKVENVPIDSVSPDPANARKHPDRNLEAIKGSLRRFGQQKPIVVDSKGVVRAGNGTLAGAKALGWTEIAIVRSDLPLSELTAYAIADNRTAELAEWDEDILAGVLSDPDLGDVGFDESEIAKLGNDDEPATPEAVSIGELFQVVVECNNEDDQRMLFDRLTAEGRKCRVLTL